MPVLRGWSKYAVGSIQTSNNSISSMLKYYIHQNINGKNSILNAMTRWKYTSCKQLSHSYDPYERSYSVIDKCPVDISADLKQKCENSGILGFAPVYNKHIGIFQNKYCAICHGLDSFNCTPMPLNFYCSPLAKDNIDMLIDSGNLKDATYMLYRECSYILEILLKMLGKRRRQKYEWLLRQTCIDQTCQGCELFCSSFKFFSYHANKIISLSGICNIEDGIRRVSCVGDRIPDYLRSELPDYSLLFSIKRKTGLQVKKLRHDNLTYDTICEKKAYLDIFNDNCIDLSDAFFIQNDGKVYLPKHDSQLEVFKVIAINFVNKSLLNQELREQSTVTQGQEGQETACDQMIMSHVIHEHLLQAFPKLNETEKLICVMLNHTYNLISDAFDVNKTEFYESEGLLVLNTDVLFDNHTCHTGDDLLLVKASIVNISGDTMVTAEVDDDQLMILSNESI